MRSSIACLSVLLLLGAVTRAEDWIIGINDPNEVITQTTDRLVDGDVIIANDGRLNLLGGATLTVTGDIFLVNGATLAVDDARISFLQAFAYQSGLQADDNATMSFNNAVIAGNGMSFGIALIGSATAEFFGVTVEDGFATWSMFETASATVTDCTNTGEFVPFGDVSLILTNCETVLLWITLFDGSTVDTTLPPPGDVAGFSLNSETPWATGIPYDVSLTDCSTVMWGLMARSGSSAVFHDSTLRVVGSHFERDNTIEIVGVANGASLSDSTYDWGDVSLRFIDSTVQAWNYYCNGTTTLTLQGCVFGELLAEESGEAWVVGSLCDGAGGYVGVGHSAIVYFVLSTNLSQTTSRQEGSMVCYRSALLGPRIDATDTSYIALLNTEYVGEPEAHDGAVIFDIAVDPVEATVGDTVSLRGTARLIAGPTSPHVFQNYSLEYGVGEEPTQWTTIGGPFSQEVRDATLGTWDTCRVAPGAYSVRVSMFHGFEDPATTTNSALLADGDFWGDADCDGDVDWDDFAWFTDCMNGPDGGIDFGCDWANLNGDNNVDLADFAEFQVAFTGNGD